MEDIMRKLPAIFLIVICIFAFSACKSEDTGSEAIKTETMQPCNRACLEGIADQYLAAMVAHDASKAPLAENFIFTENTVKLPPTEGLWFTASGLGDFHFYACDLQEGPVAWTGISKEHDNPVLLSVRLKVVNLLITEAESIVVRDVNENNLVNLKNVPPGFDKILEPSERMTREEMLRMPDIYFKALDTLDASSMPFADMFKMKSGKIRGIFAYGVMLPYGIGDGWSPSIFE
jgi:hypothetical protein